jgi:hypothetical protein
MASSPPTTTTIGKATAPENQHVTAIKALWRIVTHIDRSKINPWQALRNTIGVVAPLIVGFAMGTPRGGLAVASGALNVSYSDGSDPYARRAKRWLPPGWCSITVLLGALTAHGNIVAVMVATVWAFAAGMLVSLNNCHGCRVISTVVLLVYSAQALTPCRRCGQPGWHLQVDCCKSSCRSLCGRCGATNRKGARWRLCISNWRASLRVPAK